MRDHGKGERFLLELLAGGSASDPYAAPTRPMFCDGLSHFGRTTGKQPRDLPSHLNREMAIILGAPLRIAFTTQSPPFAVRQAFRFGLFERRFRNQNALAFVSLVRAAETDDYRGEWALHPRSAAQCRIPARKIDQLIKIGTSHAESALAVLE